jgi:hypothetical protein
VFLLSSNKNQVVMETDKVIYTDGHNVVVTDTTLKIRKASYKLNGITKHFLLTIKPERWPAVILMLVGIGLAVCGYLGMIPQTFDLETNNGSMSGNVLALYIGVGLFLLGLLILAFTRVRYAVRIATAEGEKNAIVSTKREYIAQIVDAIHSAFDLRHNRNNPIIVTKK